VAHTNYVEKVLNFIIFELTYVAYWFWHIGCFDGVNLYVAGRHLTVVKHCIELKIDCGQYKFLKLDLLEYVFTLKK
jgi:hypothetical protein